MPKIEVNDKYFFSLLGKTYTRNELENILPFAKAELDEWNEKEHLLKIELNDTNRPDLWSAAGLSRTLRLALGEKCKKPNYLSSKGDNKDTGKRSFVVDKDYPLYRQYSIGFAATGKVVDEEILKSLIQEQEKLCESYGKKRKLIAMGVYRSSLIHYPVHYCSAFPSTTRFTPLHEEREMNLLEILENVQKGKEYGAIIKDEKVFPYLKDNKGLTLSMPPIINSNDVGAVEVGDKDLFIEMSGPNLKMLLLTANIVAEDMFDMGFKILPIKVKFPYKTEFGQSITVPYYFQEKTECSIKEAEKALGVTLKPNEVKRNLLRMGITATISEDGIIQALPNSYRNDLISSVDIIEDIAIAMGLNSFEPTSLDDFTVGRLTKAERFSRKLRPILVGLGYQEMMYNYLSSKKEYADNMCVSDDNMIHILNPMSEKYEIVRPSIIPSLLKTESLSLHSPYPHKTFEIGKVATIDNKSSGGTRTDNNFALLSSGDGENYNSVSSIVSTIFYFLNIQYTLKERSDSRFIKGRSATVLVNGKEVGCFGEINPEVLENWGVDIPCVAFECNIDMLLT